MAKLILNKIDDLLPAFSSTSMNFYNLIGPRDELILEAKRFYFRFNKLKCSVSCWSENGALLAKGECASIVLNKSDIE